MSAGLMGEASLFFGTAGIPHSAEKYSSKAGIARVRALGLGAMELQFVRRVAMGEGSAQAVRIAAQEHSVRLSAHAPYYINLNSRDPQKLLASRERLLRAARVAAQCGAQNVVFHAAFYHGDPPSLVYERIRAQLQSLATRLRDEGLSVCLRAETAGKPSQFGALEEILRLSAETDGVSPCVDFGHLYARTLGELNGYSEFWAVLDRIARVLGESALRDMHIHLQGMAHTQAGERKHLNLAASDLRYEELLHALIDRGVGGTVICESPNLEEDALLLERTYRQLCARKGEPQCTVAVATTPAR
jgi:deoxyribonuclease-4